MADTVNGSCLCGGVKFAVTGVPQAIFICYCVHCSKNAGASGQISAKFNSQAVQVFEGTELTSTYILQDNLSGCDKHKVFCSRCGCTLWTIPMKHHGTHWIVRTSLLEDGLKRFPYKAEFFASRKVPVAVTEGVKSFETMPDH